MSRSIIVKARTHLTTDGLSISRISGRPATPGNVGLAFSGGGSRAASQTLGALRGLYHLGVLRYVRAISCVSGGSWCSVPFTFLPESCDELAFLGASVPDPGRLRWSAGVEPTHLCNLAAGNFGVPLTRDGMAMAAMAVDGFRDARHGTKENRLWTRQIGERLLSDFDLASFDDRQLPNDFFTASPAMASSLRMRNAELPERCYVVRESRRMPRPYLIVNGAMRVQGRDGEETLAPVQFTPYFSGVMGSGIGTLAGREVGGGGISSFAFGGEWLLGEADRPQLEIVAPLALSDITGISSAAFADALSDRGLHNLTPALTYFAPSWPRPAGTRALFADGGSLENTGVASLLSYQDIDAVIALISSPKPIEIALNGDVIVERQLAALFGYREYDRLRGYVRTRDRGRGNPDYDHNQVFASDDGQFQELIAAMGARHRAGEAVVVEREHEVVRNDRFAVQAGRKVRVLWVFSSPARAWSDQLAPEVRRHMDDDFPNIPTARTQLSAGEYSLLTHFSEWMLRQHPDALRRIFALD